jgi:hypothetical protein
MSDVGLLMESDPLKFFSFYSTFLSKTLSHTLFSLEPGFLSDYTHETIGLNLDIRFFEINICDPIDSEVKVG